MHSSSLKCTMIDPRVLLRILSQVFLNNGIEFVIVNGQFQPDTFHTVLAIFFSGHIL